VPEDIHIACVIRVMVGLNRLVSDREGVNVFNTLDCIELVDSVLSDVLDTFHLEKLKLYIRRNEDLLN
jgi:hypothetical protein